MWAHVVHSTSPLSSDRVTCYATSRGNEIRTKQSQIVVNSVQGMNVKKGTASSQEKTVVDHVKTYLFELAANQRFDIIA
jgi:hypothetical protein